METARAKRHAAQTQIGITRNVIGSAVTTNTIQPTATSRTVGANSSARFFRDQRMRGFSYQKMSAGGTTIAPSASPNHQVSHTRPYACPSANPNSDSVVTPIVAATLVLTKPANRTKSRMPRPCSKAERPPANRFNRYPPMRASSVFPQAISNEVSVVPAVVRFVTKAPKKLAGQIRGPRIRAAASAMPVGGQTAVALALTDARAGPAD